MDDDGVVIGGAVGAVITGDGMTAEAVGAASVVVVGVVLGCVGVGFGVGGGVIGTTFPVVQHTMFAAPVHRFRSNALSTQE